MTSQRADYDSPWKDILEAYFEECILFFFPDVHREIDWSQGYEFLDKELQKIERDAEVGRRYADKLVKVWTLTGETVWVLVHIEVQSQSEPDFGDRMFTYYYRLKDLFNHPVASFAILSDDSPNWRPNSFSQELWGCRNTFEFRTVKLLDYKEQWSQLEASQNPFAVVVMAHLKTLETTSAPDRRKQWKLELSKRLYERGYPREDVVALLRFIHWVISLPEPLEQLYWQEIMSYQEERGMTYLLPIEREALEKGHARGFQKGREEGREEGLKEGLMKSISKQMKRQFGESGLRTLSEMDAISDISTLEAILDSLLETPSIDDIRRLIENSRSL